MGCSPTKNIEVYSSRIGKKSFSFAKKTLNKVNKHKLKFNDYSIFEFDFVYHQRANSQTYSIPVILRFKCLELNKFRVAYKNWKLSIYSIFEKK